jgi:hypothetical protein
MCATKTSQEVIAAHSENHTKLNAILLMLKHVVHIVTTVI